MNLSAFTDDQISCVSSEALICNVKAGLTGAYVNKFDFFLPVGNKADVFIAGVPYH